MAGKRKTRAKPKARAKQLKAKAKPLKAAETPETPETAKAKGGAKAQKKGAEARKVGKSPGPGKDPVLQEAGRKGRATQPGQGAGGRKPGTPNKRTLEARAILEANGYDPASGLLYWAELIAEGRKPKDAVCREYLVGHTGEGKPIWSRPTADMVNKASENLTPYYFPKRSAVRLDVRRPHDMTDDELDAALKAALKGE